MKGRIDHVVLCVHDAAATRQQYERLGFVLTPFAGQPFGTGNHLVLLEDGFIELVAVAAPERVTPPEAGAFSFGYANARFLEKREGMSMLVLRSDDARRDHREFAERGLAPYAPFDFERMAGLPDGSAMRVAFSLAFVGEPHLPDANFFVCQHHAPSYFSTPEYLAHPNGARRLVEAVMLADAPGDLAPFFAKLTEPGQVSREGTGLRVTTPRGAICVIDPAGYAARYPGIAPIGGVGPRFVGYSVAVRDLDQTEALLRRNGAPFTRVGESLRIAPPDAFGAVIEFVAG